MKRRRVLGILAGVAALPVVGARATPNAYSWRGLALGAEAHIILDHPRAETLVRGAISEIRRLENIFSLYIADSELSRLNRDGVLFSPSFEMVELLSLCAAINLRTAGAFDPSVQALWSLYARAWSEGHAPSVARIEEARALTGWEKVSFSPSRISFERAGVMLTLNGIAQGFIADRIADYFRRNSVSNVLVNTGEIAALGPGPDGAGWPVAIGGKNGETAPLSNSAIATSAPLGTVFDRAGAEGHIIDPQTGYPGGKWRQVTVISGSAAEADGLSTAFSLMNRNDIELAKGTTQVILLPS
ncbi:MAG TPA: FAD:protein FMN transferase [Devosia sp.]|nr:FAD:protein FMN transferase [Devosia sp.]